MTPRPIPLRVRIDGIPGSLAAERRWVGWNYEWRDDEWTKAPYIATAPATRASSTDPTMWRTFDDALGANEDGKCDGIGFVLGDGWVGFDSDFGCNPAHVSLLNTYTWSTRRAGMAAFIASAGARSRGRSAASEATNSMTTAGISR